MKEMLSDDPSSASNRGSWPQKTSGTGKGKSPFEPHCFSRTTTGNVTLRLLPLKLAHRQSKASRTGFPLTTGLVCRGAQAREGAVAPVLFNEQSPLSACLECFGTLLLATPLQEDVHMGCSVSGSGVRPDGSSRSQHDIRCVTRSPAIRGFRVLLEGVERPMLEAARYIRAFHFSRSFAELAEDPNLTVRSFRYRFPIGLRPVVARIQPAHTAVCGSSGRLALGCSGAAGKIFTCVFSTTQNCSRPTSIDRTLRNLQHFAWSRS